MTLSLRLPVVSLLALLPAAAATVPAGFSETRIADGLSGTAMALAPDGRIFVCEKNGALRVIKNNALLATPFATLPVNGVGERGLLGVAIDPAFSTNGFVYVYYTTAASPIHNRVVRLTAAGDVAAGGETLIFRLNDANSATNHNGGALHFGPDGKLYIATGDNTTGTNAQTLSNLFGKILRINADGSIPTDNPFYNQASGANRAIWAMGLRNPFTFAFDLDSPLMLINDVGQNAWEEINQGAAGANFGWPTTEGLFTQSAFPNFTLPRFAYGHGTGPTTGCAITGGGFYPDNGPFPAAFRGKFFFGDYCSGWIRAFDPVTGTAQAFATGVAAPLDIRAGTDGALYYLAYNGVFRVTYSTPAPVITAQPQSLTRNVGDAAAFSVTASGAATLTYQWQRDGLDIPNATASTYSLASVAEADNGDRFRVRVRNASGEVLSNEAVLTVSAAPSITSQPQSVTRAAGEQAVFAVTATGAGLTYQWQRNGADIGGATSPTFTIATVATGDNGARFRVRVGNASGSTVSNEATLTVTPAVTITAQPQSVTRVAGESAAFSVTATGSALTYQWQRNGADISGATGASYNLPSVSAGDNGVVFRVRVRNAAGEALSNGATLTVTPAVTITAQPQSITRTVNDAASFSVTAVGSALTYQWQRNGADIAGATAASYNLASVSTSDNGARFRVRVRNAAGEALSNEAILTVTAAPAPVITSQPQSLSRTVGQAAAFSVTATGAAPLSYQWQRNGVDVAGATGAALNMASVVLADNGARLRVRVRTGAGAEAMSTEATLTVTAGAAPSITSQPQSVSRVVGQAASFGVTVTGVAPLAYQWQRNGVDIGGATAATFSIASVALADNGARFRVRVRGGNAGEAMSAEATLTVAAPVNRPPVVTILTPAVGTLYSGGMELGYSASAVDPEDGPLPASAFSWTIVFHHDDHTHPFLSDINGVAAGVAQIPDRGETAVNVFYRIHVTVRDAQGLTATATRDVLPRVVRLRIESNFNPVRVTLDGRPAFTPVNFESVAGMIRAIGAPLRQKLGTNILRFVGWSDGGALEHEIVTPAANTTYVLTYR